MFLLLVFFFTVDAPAERGVDLALKGKCVANVTRETKRTVSTAGVRCSMLLNRQNDAMSYLGWLQEAFPGDPEVLFLAAHMFSDLSDRNAQQLLNTAPESPLVIELNAENFEKH